MKQLPDKLQLIISEKLGTIEQVRNLGGGEQLKSQILVGETKYFLKYTTNLYPGLFQSEASGLELLKRMKIFRVPEVVVVGNQFLVLEWMEIATSYKLQATSFKNLGIQFAQLHKNTAKLYGLASDNYIATLPQDNKPTIDWVEFYWARRLKPQLEMARRRRKLTAEIEDLFDQLYEKLPDLLPSKPEASLLHGDLWSGNVSFLKDGTPVVYDPAVYCGHREIDLAMSELFGGFSQEFYDAYNSEWPLDSEYNDRKAIYQLYPLMVHWNLFGGGYGQQVMENVKSYI